MVTSYALKQHELDVTDKHRSNLFNWRGQFTPQFVEYLLREFATPDSYVLDPFCGSGTLLMECALKDIRACGCEINPAAYAMSRFYSFCNVAMEDRREMISSFGSKVEQLADGLTHAPLLEPAQGFRDKYKNLLEFANDLFASAHDKHDMLLAVLLLFHAESSRQRGLSHAIQSACSTLRRDLLRLPYTRARIMAHLCDARCCHERFQSKVDLIISSPPYINVFNYHQNHRAILELMGFDILGIARSEVGSNRKNRANRFLTVIQYSLEMQQALQSMAKSLVEHGFLILVIGRESRVRGVPFCNSRIVSEMIESLGSFEPPAFHERKFTNRFGEEIKEDILIARKTREGPFETHAREIALAHLKKAVSRAEGSARQDLSEAMEMIDAINPSPFFDAKGIF